MARLTEAGVERQKQQILSSALKVFNEKGYAGTKLDEIAKSSGISRSPLYYHFKDKKTLYQAVLTYAVENWLKRIHDIADKNSDVFDIIEEMLVELFNGENSVSTIALNELRVHPESYVESAKEYYDNVYKIRHFLIDLLESAKEKGQMIDQADCRLIAENISAYNSGLSDMRFYFTAGGVKMFDLEPEEYTKTLAHEYVSNLRLRYEKKNIS